MITVKVTALHPTSLTADSFTELMQREVTQPGIDPTWRQVLIDVRDVEGGMVEFTLHCEPRDTPLRVDQSLRVWPTTPPAYVRVMSEAGDELHAGKHAAPFHPGQPLAIGEDHYEVIDQHWPGRDPETGACAGSIDWQHVTVRRVDAPPMFPSALD